jgi:hypothetical protein
MKKYQIIGFSNVKAKLIDKEDEYSEIMNT